VSGLKPALLYELDDQLAKARPNGRSAIVQFNPETLKVSYANQVVDPPAGAGSQKDGTASRQFVGAGSTKLALQLWFDINSPMPDPQTPVDDVRRLTQKVTALMNPTPSPQDKTKFVPPVVRFEWGSFKFDGIVDSLEESLEYFSEDGVPLRASISLSMSQQKILFVAFEGPGTGRVRASPGTAPLATATQGSSVQGLADAAGRGGQWQGIASAAGIENPRLLAPGQLISLQVRAGALPGS
jgi:hypothetical protein